MIVEREVDWVVDPETGARRPDLPEGWGWVRVDDNGDGTCVVRAVPPAGFTEERLDAFLEKMEAVNNVADLRRAAAEERAALRPGRDRRPSPPGRGG